MNKKIREKELKLESQLVVVTIYTLLSLALITTTVVLKWELWTIPLVTAGIISVWVLHITQKLPERFRLAYYLIIMLIQLFYFGSHPQGVFSLPILLFIILALCTIIDKPAGLYLTVATYFLIIAYHAFILHTLVFTPLIEFLRLLFGIFSSIVACVIANYVIQRRMTEKRDFAIVIKELENTTRRAEDFLTNVSHELRTPINAVTGMTDVMLRNEENPEKRRDLKAIQQAGQRLFSQISDILDYTELDTGKIRISQEPYMISSTITDLISDIKNMENPNNLELIFDISPSVPSVLLGDDTKIKKIIRHLVDNSLKFTKIGGVYIQVSVLKKDYGVNLCIRVDDTGIGIENAELDKIYERFYQVDAGRSRRTGGMGLGLSIVYGLVQEMGGFLSISPLSPQGTSVRISIPQHVVDDHPCMSVEKNDRTCIAAYTLPRKYATPEIREFYDMAIEHLRAGLGVTLHKASSLSELKKIQNAYSLTHIYIGREEYEEAPAYFEKLGESICVIVIANEKYLPKGDSRIIPLEKPFVAFPITNIIENGSKIYMRDTFFAEKRMICPGIRALVVDDDEMNLMVASGILNDYQMDVTVAISGLEAISLCEENSYDIVFMDHMMPDMDGIETMRRIKNIVRYSDENVVIVALTANAVSGAREMFLQEGFDEFVAKPIETSSFERVLKKVLPVSAIQFVAKKAKQKKSSLTVESGAVPQIRQEETASPADVPPSAANPLAQLESIGVNTSAALAYCRDDIPFYLDLLKGFARDAAGKADDIARFYEKQDWENYRIRVHALKSAAKTIGLDELSKDAESLENAAKRGDVPYIEQNTASLLEPYRALTLKILALFTTEEQKAREPSLKSAESVPSEQQTSELISKLGALKESLDTLEGDKAESIITELESQFFNAAGEKTLLAEIRALVQDFDYEIAGKKVRALLDSARTQTGEAK